MRAGPRVIVFCDLDSLLSSSSVQVPAGRPATLEHLDDGRVSVVLCSRKTRAELDWFTQQLGIRAPFVTENGGGVFVPGGYFDEVPGSRQLAGYEVVEFGRSYASVVDLVRRSASRAGVNIRAMADMSIEEASQRLGIPLPLGRLAKLRDYTELFDVADEDRPRLFRALRGVHLHCMKGDRLDHAGATVDASLGVALLRSLYRRACDAAVTIGIADASAEPDLLRLVDYPLMLSTRSARTLAFPAPLLNGETPLTGHDAAAMLDTVLDIVAAVRRVGHGAAALVNERFV